jgi:hypothetical protein
MGAVNLAQATVDRSAVTTGLDDAIFTMHWGGAGAGPMDGAARTTATNAIKTFWTACAGFIHNTHVLREVKWYDLSNTAPHKTSFIETIKTGAAPGTPGTSGGLFLPPQVACSVTLKTNLRKHWGRFYLPGFTGTQLDDNAHRGAWKPATVDAIAAAAATLCQQANGPTVIVWSQTAGSATFIDHVQVDDVADVIRRRRMKIATYKKALAV